MTLQQLRYVAEIAQYGSMNEAAKRMYVSQPTMSQTIRDLEKELGFSIFVRTNRGVKPSPEGIEFLTYARAILDQEDALMKRYFAKRDQRASLAISSQHYDFVTDAFLELAKTWKAEEYNYSIKEERTEEIIADIKGFRSEIGILYVSNKNEKMMLRYLRENHMEFTHLCDATPHVILHKGDELTKLERISMEQLKDHTYLYFDQKDTDPIYFSEEILTNVDQAKRIAVSDRATIFRLLGQMKSYTITTGIAGAKLEEEQMVLVPLELDVTMKIGFIKLENSTLSPIAQFFIKILMQNFQK